MAWDGRGTVLGAGLIHSTWSWGQRSAISDQSSYQALQACRNLDIDTCWIEFIMEQDLKRLAAEVAEIWT
jgi:hypothetical protein